MVLLFENFHMSDSMLDPSTVKMKNKRPGSPGPQWGQASSFSVDMHTPMPLSAQAVLGTQGVDEKAGTLVLFFLLVDAASKLPRRTGSGNGILPTFSRLWTQRDRPGQSQEAREYWIGTAGSCCPLPHFILLPGQLGEVWVWWGLAGELQEGPVLSKNADPGVVK